MIVEGSRAFLAGLKLYVRRGNNSLEGNGQSESEVERGRLTRKLKLLYCLEEHTEFFPQKWMN
jgi:hypothetical protein